MPYKTTWNQNGILWQFSGYVTAAEIEKANIEFYSDERSDNATCQIIDATRVTEIEWNDIKIKEMAAKDKGASLLLPKMKVAYISNNSTIHEVLKKYIEISRRLNSNWEFKGFSNQDEAFTWVKQNDYLKQYQS